MADEPKTTTDAQPETPPDTPAKTYTEAEYTALQAQLADAQKQLGEANTAIQSFQDMDIDGIKQSAEAWKQKAEQLEAAQKEKAHSDALDRFVQAQGMRNEIYAAHLKGQLEAAELKFDKDGTLIGGEDIVKKLRQSCPDAFADTAPKPAFVDSTPGDTRKTPDDAAIRRIMGLK